MLLSGSCCVRSSFAARDEIGVLAGEADREAAGAR